MTPYTSTLCKMLLFLSIPRLRTSTKILSRSCLIATLLLLIWTYIHLCICTTTTPPPPAIEKKHWVFIETCNCPHVFIRVWLSRRYKWNIPVGPGGDGTFGAWCLPMQVLEEEPSLILKQSPKVWFTLDSHSWACSPCTASLPAMASCAACYPCASNEHLK